VGADFSPQSLMFIPGLRHVRFMNERIGTRSDCPNYNGLDSYSEGTGFESLPGHRLYLLMFPQSLQENIEIILQLGHDRFLPNHFQFICYPTITRCIV
jgi:hypothetical protein